MGKFSCIRFCYCYRMTRILNNRHWIIDVIVGAALGILLTEMAYRLVKTIFKDRELINTDYNH